MRFKNALVLICIISSSTGWCSQVQVLKSPAWYTSRWTDGDARYRAIRAQLDQLWGADVVDVKRVEALYRKNVLPYHREFQEARYTGKLDPVHFFWLVALEFYFSDLRILYKNQKGVDIGALLNIIPIPSSYEFVRVAFGLSVECGEVMPPYSLSARLLERVPDDPLVRYYTVRLDLKTEKLKSLVSRSVKIAQDLLKEYPNRNQMWQLEYDALFNAWGEMRTVEYGNMILSFIDKALQGQSKFLVSMRPSLKFRRQYVLDQAKARGIKLGS